MTHTKASHVLSVSDFSKERILEILDRTQSMKSKPHPGILAGKIMASCFFEPSTRTRLSFEAAMKRLGGDVIGFSESKSTSVSKKETLFDTIKVVSGYADIIVLRHPLDGAARHASEASSIPVINAGDGSNQHPTQTLLDLFSIRESQGRLDNIQIGFTGDLKHSRTIHSLVQACAHFSMRMYFVADQGLELSSQVCDDLKNRGILFSFHQTLEEIMPKLDILYMTRVQEERMSTLYLHENKNLYTLTIPYLKHVKPSFRVLHPLPRVREIHPDIDESQHAYYFEQAQNGVFVRQALLSMILGKEEV